MSFAINRFCMLDVEQFIQLVEERQAIWNPSFPDYVNKAAKRIAWEEIAQHLYEDFMKMELYEKDEVVRNLQRKWKNLRDAFVKDIKVHERESKIGAERRRRKYVYHDLLVFLFPTLMESRTSILQTTIDNFDEGQEVEDEPSISLQSPKPEQTAAAAESKSSKRKKWSEIDSLEAEFLDNMNKKLKYQNQLFETDGDDSDKHFLLSLLADFRKISDENKISAKTDIMYVIEKWQKEIVPIEVKSEHVVVDRD